jgi:O-acetyl-ADP-ribose deacetylase (regulator of RNase III)
VRLHLVDVAYPVVEAWREAFADRPEVDVIEADILSVAHGALVSPANSLGRMDGGIDQLYIDHFGMGLQRAVDEAIQKRPQAMVPVGAAEVVRTRDARIPYLIVAPTMEVPEEVPARHAYRALRAVLRAARRHAVLFEDVFCPGLATGIGRVPPAEAAAEMRRAFDDDLSAPR